MLDAPGDLLTMNHAKQLHFRKWADLTKLWREAAYVEAVSLKLPRLDALVGIEGHPRQKGGVLADAGAHTPCLKACVDGLRDAGLLVDDSPKYVAWVRCWAPVKSERPGMVLELVPLF